jgi:hypothetical protein
VRHEELHLDANYTMSKRIRLHGSINRGRDEYHGNNLPVLQIRESDDFSYGAGLSFDIGRKISLTLDGMHRRRRADLPTFNFDSNRVWLGLVGRF